MKLKYDFVVNHVAGEIVAVSVGNNNGFNGYIKLNESGAFIFNALKNDITREEIITSLGNAYPDANEKDVVDSVDELIEQLKKADLLI